MCSHKVLLNENTEVYKFVPKTYRHSMDFTVGCLWCAIVEFLNSTEEDATVSLRWDNRIKKGGFLTYHIYNLCLFQ